jgi:DNA-binding NarL/FixJ family response regulator
LTHTDEHPKRYRVFVVEDHPLVRRALKRLLSEDPSLEVVGEATSAEDALVVLSDMQSDIVLMNFSLPGMNGVELIRQLRRSYPEMRCLMVSSHHERYYVDAALAAGAHGYVLKDDPEMLLRAVAGVLRGETVVELQ